MDPARCGRIWRKSNPDQSVPRYFLTVPLGRNVCRAAPVSPGRNIKSASSHMAAQAWPEQTLRQPGADVQAFSSEPRAACRRILFCVGDRDKEIDGTWAWAMRYLLDPSSDALTFVHVHRGMTLAPLPPNERPSAEPFSSWLGADIVQQASGFRMPPHYVEVSCNMLTSPGDALLERLATLQPADLPHIVITGSRGMDGFLMRLLTTSTSHTLASEGEHTLLCVRPHAGEAARVAPCVSPPRVVAIALDPSADTARAQIDFACKYVLRPSDEVKLLMGPGTKEDLKTKHSATAVAHATVVLNAAKHALEPFLSAASASSPECVALPDNIDVRDGIAEWLEEHRPVDLIVLGRRSANKKLKRSHVGSVSSYILRHARCAVLIVNEATLHEKRM